MDRDEFRRLALDVCTPEQIAALDKADDDVSRSALLANIQYVHFWLFVIAALLACLLWRLW
jgi:hypothetical protein